MPLPYPYLPGTDLPDFQQGVQANFVSLEGQLDPLAATAPTRVTSLPSNPFDGQQVYYIDTGTGATWHFMYRSGSSSASKWDFMGGPPLVVEVVAQVAITSTTYAALSGSAGPVVTAPLAGDYIINLGALVVAGGQTSIRMSVALGGAATTAADTESVAYSDSVALNGASIARTMPRTLTAGEVLTAGYKSSSGTISGTFLNRFVSLLPVRVGP